MLGHQQFFFYKVIMNEWLNWTFAKSWKKKLYLFRVYFKARPLWRIKPFFPINKYWAFDIICAWLSGAFTITTNIHELLWACVNDIFTVTYCCYSLFLRCWHSLFVVHSLKKSAKKKIQYCFNDGHPFIILAWIKSIIQFKYVILCVCAAIGFTECIFIITIIYFLSLSQRDTHTRSPSLSFFLSFIFICLHFHQCLFLFCQN